MLQPLLWDKPRAPRTSSICRTLSAVVGQASAQMAAFFLSWRLQLCGLTEGGLCRDMEILLCRSNKFQNLIEAAEETPENVLER